MRVISYDEFKLLPEGSLFYSVHFPGICVYRGTLDGEDVYVSIDRGAEAASEAVTEDYGDKLEMTWEEEEHVSFEEDDVFVVLEPDDIDALEDLIETARAAE